MSLNLIRTRQFLQDFEFGRLFVEELGWSPPSNRHPVAAKAADVIYTRAVIAELAGIGVFSITTQSGSIPDAKARIAIQKQVAEHCYENLIIFTDAARTQSLWYWVKREAGKSHARDHLYVKGQPGDLFISKLAAMVVDISELDTQGNIALAEVASRLKKALDVERVTKKFYGEFDVQRLEFIELIRGIANEHQRRWYASVLMNRLMFIYFLQKKFFLDNRNTDYLTDKLNFSRKKLGADKFYPVFLKALFFEGFAKPEPARSNDVRALLGKIRYLNGGLFLPHHVELNHGFLDKPRIIIPDRAFENVFTLFGRYSWNLNDTPGGQADEINPDVLGYIFEKYINQKEFGAYYTRPEMTGYLCERTIFKLVLDRVNQAVAADVRRRTTTSSAKGNPPPHVGGYNSISDLLLNLDAKICRALVFEILPALRLLDPACGSGAFRVAAMKVLINIYSAILGKVELEFLGDPGLKKWHDEVHGYHRAPAYYIKKRIITENLFGVDIMEEATEIARLRLFLALVASAQTEDQLEPLPNIDFNILAGNSLIGLLHVDPKKFDSEVGRVSPLRAAAGSSDDGAHGVTRPTQGRMTLVHEPGKDDLGFVVETKTAPTRAEKTTAFVAQQNAARFAAILEDKNKSIELYRKHAFAPFGVPASAGPRNAKPTVAEPPEGGNPNPPADFADLVDQNERVLRLREHIERVRCESYARLNQMLLDEFNALGIQFEQATWDDKKNDVGKPEKRRLRLSDIEALHPFHWGYEFDKVMADGGFDGIITNPPWDVFEADEKEFFQQFENSVRKKKIRIEDWKKQFKALMKDLDLRQKWLAYVSELPHQAKFFKMGSQYHRQVSVIAGQVAASKINLFKLFLEQSFNLLRPGGCCGTITPGSIYTDRGAMQLRKMLFEQAEMGCLFGLSNERFIFEEVHHAQKFCIFTFCKGRVTDAFEASFRINPREAVAAEELDAFLHGHHLRVPVKTIRKLSPDSLSLTEFRSEADIEIAEKLSAILFLGDDQPGAWSVVLTQELNMTSDSNLFRTSPGKGRLPLIEGKMLWQFEHRYVEPRYWLDESETRQSILGREPDHGQQLPYQDYRFSHRRIAASTNERTAIATVLPPDSFCGDTALTVRNAMPHDCALFLAAIFNSFVVDWDFRQRVTTHLDMHFVYKARVPRLSAGDAAFGPIVQRAVQLICTTPEFDALAKEVSAALKLPPTAVKGVTDAAARARLRAELDGLIAHLYGLTESEFAHILTTFPLVAQGVKDAALVAYRAATNGDIK